MNSLLIDSTMNDFSWGELDDGRRFDPSALDLAQVAPRCSKDSTSTEDYASCSTLIEHILILEGDVADVSMTPSDADADAEDDSSSEDLPRCSYYDHDQVQEELQAFLDSATDPVGKVSRPPSVCVRV